MISSLYAAAARRRREWFAARPDARRRLRHPVISVGNIAAGGRGKTPFTAFLAKLLMELGERPAVLSRGYARAENADGVVVVRDAGGIRSDLARAGDEPMMLARQLPGAIVVSGPDRFLGGTVAERHLGATVHVLDDGFQHFAIDRDVDIVLIAEGDAQARTLPGGPLREPPDVLIAADAIVTVDLLETRGRGPDHPRHFRAARTTGAPMFPDSRPAPFGGRVIALAGIADPAPFFALIERLGYTLAHTARFPDHHRYSSRDLSGLVLTAGRVNGGAIITTEKDYVRLLPHRPFPLPVGYVPLTMDVEPLDDFRRWLADSIAAARDIVLG